MNQEKIIKDLVALPPMVQKEAAEYIASLKLRYGQGTGTKKLLLIEDEPFVGMWEKRSDLIDSTNRVRELRKNEWG